MTDKNNCEKSGITLEDYKETWYEETRQNLLFNSSALSEVFDIAEKSFIGYNEADSAMCLDAVYLALAIHYGENKKEIRHAKLRFFDSLSRSSILESLIDARLTRSFMKNA